MFDLSFLLMVSFLVFALLFVLYKIIFYYKKCPPNKVLVVFGKVNSSTGKPYVNILSGGTFVWPIIQDYRFLDLTPFTTELNLKYGITQDNERVHIKVNLRFQIDKREPILSNASERLLDLTKEEISLIVKDISFGKMRYVLSQYSQIWILENRDQIENEFMLKIQEETFKIGVETLAIEIQEINLKKDL